MQGTGTSATAMLVGTSADVGERPDAATITLERDEIEEALASDLPLELILSVKPGASEPQDVRVAWQRSDLETVLAGATAGPVTFSFDRAELYRALEHPDFEGHGMREIVLLVAAGASSAALMASTASAQLMDAGGGGTIGAAMEVGGGGSVGAAMEVGGGGSVGAATDVGGGGSGAAPVVVMPGHDEATTARDLGAASVVVPGHEESSTASVLAASAATHDEAGLTARGVGQTIPGADEATLMARGIDPAIATAIGTGDATTARDLATPAPADSGTSFELPSVDGGTAAVVGGLAGASLLILGGAFAVRRQRVTPV